MKKNVCIIHYNTPVLTSCLVKSINIHTPGATIYIFDNSDKKPFVNEFENVKVFDNTKGQIINFEKWLRNYPNKDKSGGKANRWGSAKHAYSVERCMQLIGESFVLLDSDVLVKKDITPLFDSIHCFNGEIIQQPRSIIHRVAPFICFINVPLCKKKGVHYFDERYMHGLRVGPSGDSYDTGAALYILAKGKGCTYGEIKTADYIEHYANGSWVPEAEKMGRKKHLPEKEWLQKYKNLWAIDTPVKKNADKVPFNKFFDHIYCIQRLPDKEGVLETKAELRRVGIDDKASYFSWLYEYPSPLLDLVFENEHVKMDVSLKSSGRPWLKRMALKHYEVAKDAIEKGYKRILVMEGGIKFHNDLAYLKKMLENMPESTVILFDKMTCSAFRENVKYKEYIKTLPENTLYGDIGDIFFIFSSCYSLNQKGMAHIVSRQENMLLPPDTPFNDHEIKGSFAVLNLAIRDPKIETRSSESYERIGLDVSVYGGEEEEPDVLVESQYPGPRIVSSKLISPTEKGEQPQPVSKILPPPSAKKMQVIKKGTIAKSVFIEKTTRTRTRHLYVKPLKGNKLYDL